MATSSQTQPMNFSSKIANKLFNLIKPIWSAIAESNCKPRQRIANRGEARGVNRTALGEKGKVDWGIIR